MPSGARPMLLVQFLPRTEGRSYDPVEFMPLDLLVLFFNSSVRKYPYLKFGQVTKLMTGSFFAVLCYLKGFNRRKNAV